MLPLVDDPRLGQNDPALGVGYLSAALAEKKHLHAGENKDGGG